MNNHHPEWAIFDTLIILLLAAAAVAYVGAHVSSRRRRPWPVHRTVLWILGLACAGAGLAGPIATAAHSSFTAHMAGHLLVGMLAPLLLVLAAPVTLAYRALPVPAARVLSGCLRTPYVHLVTHPVTAGVLNLGGLWLLYATDLFLLMHSSVLVHAVVHAHILLSGYLFTASLVGVDPNPHPSSMRIRSMVLIVFIAGHSILAKWLYAHPPAGIGTTDGQVGAQLMYYGGDVVDVVLIVLLFAGWYRTTRPRPGRRRARLSGSAENVGGE